jgi:hypothetical protein
MLALPPRSDKRQPMVSRWQATRAIAFLRQPLAMSLPRLVGHGDRTEPLPIWRLNAPLLRPALVAPGFLALFNPARSERVSSVFIVLAARFV